MVIYLIIGLLYWALNSFVRKIETSGDWLLPLVWFFLWPLAFISWGVIFATKGFEFITDWLATKSRTKHF